MSQRPPTDRPVPEVLIVGAGICGLTLAILLEQINIPYQIFERASVVKPLGSSMVFAGNVFPVLEQLGIYEEIKKVSNPYDKGDYYDGNLKKLGSFNVEQCKIATGYDCRVFARPRFYEILLKRVPAHKISFKKKVVRTEEKDGKVTIYCSDDTSYTGDILVGADGAHSETRQNLYKNMDEKGILPKSDLEDFSIGHTTIVGVAAPSNPEKYPQLKSERVIFDQILYEGGCSCYVAALPDNQIGWGFGQQLSETDVKEIQSRNSEWGPQARDTAYAILEKYRDFPSPLGGTMGEIFDATPRDLISKVLLEEKLFKTWHHGRTVLLGDACHKFHPAGAQGAMNAIFDAVILANGLYNMNDTSDKSITTAFEYYSSQRYHRTEAGFNESVAMAKIMNGQKWSERLIRNVVLNYIPSFIMDAQLRKILAYRPQVAWLPLVENRGEGPVTPQEFK
ncbi:hypothetical protein BGZ79_005723 [Entomortierella chlamydospora]|nr:hypothetical protein BGZ79_005723 [Entomortierella chlamydospora]